MKYRILFFLKWKASGFIKKVWPNSSISVHHKTNMRKISILKFRRNATQLQNSLRIFARRPQTRAHASALAFQTLAFFFSVALRPNAGHWPPHAWGFWSTHNNASQSAGLLWTSDQPVAETSTWQHKTLNTDKTFMPRRDSKPQSQQASGRRPTP